MGPVLWAIIGCGLLSLVYGAYTVRAVMASDAGTPRMQEIAAAIQEGAERRHGQGRKIGHRINSVGWVFAVRGAVCEAF